MHFSNLILGNYRSDLDQIGVWMLNIGDAAPNFILPDSQGKNVNLSDKKGKWIILYFYPKDMTPGCTQQACDFNAHQDQFSGLNAEIIGISKDSAARHTKFIEKYNLNFTLLSDEDNTACEAYGVWQKKKLYGKEFMGIVRTTFIINPEGKIAHIFNKVRVKEHNSKVLEQLTILAQN